MEMVKGYPCVAKVEEVPISRIPKPLRGKWAGLVQDLLLRLEATSPKSALCYSFNDPKQAQQFLYASMKQLKPEEENGAGRWVGRKVTVGGYTNVYIYYENGK